MKSVFSIRVVLLLALLGGLAAAPPAQAGSFQVNPVNMVMPHDRSSASVTIKNSDTEPVAVRVIAYRWTQEQGQDVYSPTNEVVASPPIFTIPPGRTQLLRVGLKRRPISGAYRIIVEEIPRRQPAGAQIQVALRLNLPLYLLPREGKPDLSWSTWRDGNGEWVVEGANRGSLHDQVLELRATDTSGKEIILSKQMGVILPSSMKRWKIGTRPDFRVGSSMVLKVRKTVGETQAQVVLAQR